MLILLSPLLVFVFFWETLISCKANKHTIVSRSFVEVEFCAFVATTCEIIWISQLLTELQVPLTSPALIFCDNDAALHIAPNPMFHERTNHIELHCHFIHEKTINGVVKLLLYALNNN